MARGAFERTVALRYLWGVRGSRGGSSFLRFVTGVALGGVAVGTAALLLALSIVRGFSAEIGNKVVGFGQHVQVEHFLGEPLGESLGGADSLATRLAGFEGVEAVVPAVIEFALLRSRSAGAAVEIDGALVWGTPPEGQPFIASHLSAGAFTFAPDSAGHAGLVLGEELARRLGLGVGEAVIAYSTRTLRQGHLGSRPKVAQFYVAGIFETGVSDFDDRFAYTDLDVARRFFGYAPDEVGRFDLVLDDIERSRETADAVTGELGAPILARSIYDVFRHLFAWVALQQSMIPLVISVLVIVAAFNIIGTLLMMILDKTREIGILLSMGASSAAVRRLFLWLGFLIGVVGSAAGAGLALGLALLQLRFALIPLPQEAYYIDTAPVELHALDFVLVPAIATVLCTLAAYLPARAAARVEPIRSIRFGG